MSWLSNTSRGLHGRGVALNLTNYHMKTSLRTLKKYQSYVENTFLHPYTNGPIKGINNKIKGIKRIAIGFRSFSTFKTRILISCNTVQK